MTPYYADDWLTVYHGDCRTILAELPAESVHCVVTSPPYWGLRDYGVDGQLGLEASPEEYVEALVAVFREVRRVLRTDGTVWLNLGDSYASHDPGGRRDGEFLNPGGRPAAKGSARNRAGNYRPGGLKPKDRLLMPARVALALQADGWWLRDEIVWHKPNPMPSSVADRTTPAHEMVYLLTKSRRYAYNADAIKEPAPVGDHPRNVDRSGRQGGDWRDVTGQAPHTGLHRVKVPGGWDVDPGRHDAIHRTGRTSARYKTVDDPNVRGLRQAPEPGEPNAFHPLGRNKRSVWSIATEPYPEAHFATFPQALVEPCVKAGCPEGATVLDPFAGSGTVGRVAQRLSRRAVLIDLNPDYLMQAMERNRDIPLGLESA